MCDNVLDCFNCDKTYCGKIDECILLGSCDNCGACRVGLDEFLDVVDLL